MNRWLTGALAALMLSPMAYAEPPGNRDRSDYRDEYRDDRDRRDDDRGHEDRDRHGHDKHSRDQHGNDRHDGPPAWGLYKDKNPNHPKYRGHSGAVYVHDYGISSGRCDVKAVTTAIGAGTGAVIGSHVAEPENRVVGIIIGSVVGAVLGNAIGDKIDNSDRACMGHALELGAFGKPVIWSRDGHNYHFVPVREGRDGCRYARLKVDSHAPRDVLACPAGHGEWRFSRP